MRVGKNLWTGLAAAALFMILALVGWGLLDDGPGSQPRLGALSEPASPTPVLAEGSRPATGDLEGEESDIVPMTPFRVPEITGTVLDPDGLGVGEARVVAEPLRPGTAAGDVEARTDSGGRFAIASDGAWGFGLHVSAAGFEDAVVESVPAGERGIIIRLRPAPRVWGHVRTAAMTPVAGASVTLRARMEHDALHVVALTAATDEGGRFELDGRLLDLDVYEDHHIEAEAPGFAPWSESIEHRVFEVWHLRRTTGTLVALRHDVVLAPGGSVTGCVSDAAGRAIPDAHVRLWEHGRRTILEDPATGRRVGSPLAPRLRGETVSDAGGRYRLDGIPIARAAGGTQDSPWGSVQAVVPGRALGGAPVAWSSESAGGQEIDLVVHDGVVVRGRAVDTEGLPIAGSIISVLVRGWEMGAIDSRGTTWAGIGDRHYWRLQPGGWGWLTAGTAIEGSFETLPLPLRPPATTGIGVYISGREGFAKVACEIHAGPAHDLGDVVIPGARSPIEFVGRVIDPEERAVRGARIELQDAGWTLSDGDGSFSFTLFAEGRDLGSRQDLRIMRRGFAQHREVLPAILPEDPLVVRLSRGSSLSGRILFEDGSPVPHARVDVEKGERQRKDWVFSDIYANTEADAEGRFTIECLPPGPYRVEYEERTPFRARRAFRQVVGEMTDLLLILPGTPGLHRDVILEVTDAATGVAPPGSFCAEIAQDGSLSLVGHDGRVSIPAVPPGSYTVSVDVPGRGRIERQLLIPEGTGPFVCAFTVGAPSDLSVRLVPPPPEELTGLSVVAHHPEQRERFATRSAEGFRFEGLPPGPWTLRVRSVPDQPESLLSTQDVTVVLPRPHPATGDIEVPVHALARISFVLPVRRPEDGPIPGYGIGGNLSSVESGDAGQAWWNHFHRYQRRARDFRFSLHDAGGRQIFSTAPTSIQLDQETQSVRASLIIPAGRFTAKLSGPEGLALEAPLRSEEPFLDW